MFTSSSLSIFDVERFSPNLTFANKKTSQNMYHEIDNMPKKPKTATNIMDLFQTKDLVKICAPMVRYSKLQFRNLLKFYNCDLCYTPMILADSFCKSDKARNNEFTTNLNDIPLVTQFAANTVHDFVGAAYMVSPYCDGVDLNCGCPQRWAKQQGLGCVMLKKPEVIYDLVRQCRNAIPKPFTVSVKMRLKKTLQKSVEICRQLEKCGVSFLTVHGRTPDQLTGDVNFEALRTVVDSVRVPVVANGGVKTWDDCVEMQQETNCKGVMVANGLLTNPSLFTDTSTTPTDCVQRWLDICYNTTLTTRVNSTPTIPEKPPNLTFQCFHHHLVFMLEKTLTRCEKRVFNNLQTFEEVLNFVADKFDVAPHLFDVDDFEKTRLLDIDYTNRSIVYEDLKTGADSDKGCDFLYDFNCEGKYFKSRVDEDCDWSGIFLENG